MVAPPQRERVAIALFAVMLFPLRSALRVSAPKKSFAVFVLRMGMSFSRCVFVIARSGSDEAIQSDISAWIASLTLAMTSRSRDAFFSTRAMASAFSDSSPPDFDPVVHAEGQHAKRRGYQRRKGPRWASRPRPDA